jgi:hypothetical protein
LMLVTPRTLLRWHRALGRLVAATSGPRRASAAGAGD